MFATPNVWMVLKAAKLTTAVDPKGMEHRVAECSLVIDPFPRELALELGESVANHFFTEDGAIREEVSAITLDPRVPKQRVHTKEVHDQDHANELQLVEILSMTVAKQDDEKTGKVWFKATFKVQFDLRRDVHGTREPAALAQRLREMADRIDGLHADADVLRDAAAVLARAGESPQHGSEVLCDDCAIVFCPHAERLHFHHDGCPICDGNDSVPTDAAAPAPLRAGPPLDIPEMRANLHATFDGGWHKEEPRRAFHHGMDTVCNVLEAHQKRESTNRILPAQASGRG